MRVLFITIWVIILDQATKLWIKAQFLLYDSVQVLGDFFRITYIENPGMAFGLRFAGPWFFTLFSFIASIALIVVIYRMRTEPLLPRATLALVLGGAIGNLIDRFAYGQVIDFLDFGLGGKRFPVFNVADSAVTIGMVMLIFLVLFEKDDSKKDTSRLPYQAKDLPDSEEKDIWHSDN